MIIQISLQADNKRVILTVPQANMHEEIKNIVAYTQTKESGHLICALGDDASDLQNKSPEEWAKLKSDISFAHPFDIGQFSPGFAITFLKYYTTMAHINARRHAWQAIFMDRLDYDIEIKGYEDLPIIVQQEFEYALQKSALIKIRHLTINGQDKTKAYQQCVRAARLLKLMGIFWGLVLWAAGWILWTNIIFPERHKSLTGIEGIVPSVAILLGAIGLGCIGIFLGALSTVLVLRRSMPSYLLRNVLLDAKLGLPKPVMNWLITEEIFA